MLEQDFLEFAFTHEAMDQPSNAKAEHAKEQQPANGLKYYRVHPRFHQRLQK